MKTRFTVVMLAAIAVLAADVLASGRIGFYGIIEKVVFEPNETAAERIQVWGAFMYVDGGASKNFAVSAAKRGYLYFKIKSLHAGYTSQAQIDLNKKEWADLKAVAGTGQAVAFGSYGYIGSFGVLEPSGVAAPPSFLFENRPAGGDQADLRVRPATEAPSNPATYQTETGVVKINEAGSHADVVKELKRALKVQ